MRVKNIARIFLLMLLFSHVSQAYTQNAYWLKFSDKKENEPVSQRYLQKLINNNISIIGTSTWLNMAMVELTPDQLKLMSDFQFIQKISKVDSISSEYNYYRSDSLQHKSVRAKQVGWFEYDIIKKLGLSGKGIRIAVFDGGFPKRCEKPWFKLLKMFNEKKFIDFEAE